MHLDRIFSVVIAYLSEDKIWENSTKMHLTRKMDICVGLSMCTRACVHVYVCASVCWHVFVRETEWELL